MSSDSPSPTNRPKASLGDREVPHRLRRWLAPQLLDWFRAHGRDLPWRRDRDPFRIWVSEVMLQQTQVATVIPYFERFLSRFPTLETLARADEQEVLRLWEGLGYYRRARHLLQSARRLAEEHQGVFPSNPETLHGLPGLGEYTRNAVLSQAFDLRLPILEANSARVLSRLFGRSEDPKEGPARRWLWNAAEAVLPIRDVGDFNQALMELGALVCTPEKPDCVACPVSPRCAAYQSGRPEDFPRRTAPAAPTQVHEVAVVIFRRGRVLLAQRPANASRWASLWEVPHGELLPGETHEQAGLRLARELTGLEVRLGAELTTIRHGVTRFRITMVCHEAECAKGAVDCSFHDQAVWVEPERLAEFPVSSPQRKLAKLLAEDGRQRRLF